jgi:hypothetical protein
MLTALEEEPPVSAGYRGSDLVRWHITEMLPAAIDGLLRSDTVEKFGGSAIRIASVAFLMD